MSVVYYNVRVPRVLHEEVSFLPYWFSDIQVTATDIVYTIGWDKLIEPYNDYPVSVCIAYLHKKCKLTHECKQVHISTQYTLAKLIFHMYISHLPELKWFLEETRILTNYYEPTIGLKRVFQNFPNKLSCTLCHNYIKKQCNFGVKCNYIHLKYYTESVYEKNNFNLQHNLICHTSKKRKRENEDNIQVYQLISEYNSKIMIDKEDIIYNVIEPYILASDIVLSNLDSKLDLKDSRIHIWNNYNTILAS
jgi:hypothetical protein